MARTTWLILWTLLLACSPLAALEKPRVAIRFSLAEPEYRKALTDTQILDLEEQVRSYIAINLAAKIGFMNFVAPQASEHLLDINLIRADTKDMDEKPLLGEVIFRIDFKSPNLESVSPERWPFRGYDDINKVVGEKDDFEEEIIEKLSQADVRGLLTNHLSQISIAERGKLLSLPSLEDTQQVAWKLILPYRQMEICMELGSMLRVLLEFPTEVGIRRKSYTAEVALIFDPPNETILEEWRFRMFSDIDHQPQDILNQFKSNPTAIQIGGIFVTDYLFNRTSCQLEITAPDEVEF